MIQSRQTRINDFLINKATLLRKELKEAVQNREGRCHRTITALIADVYEAVRACESPAGRSARNIASQLKVAYCDDCREDDISIDSVTEACLSALKTEGYVYTTFDDKHFRASVTHFDGILSDIQALSMKIPSILSELSMKTASQNSNDVTQNQAEDSAPSSTKILVHRRRNISRIFLDMECSGRFCSSAFDFYAQKAIGITRNVLLYTSNQAAGLFQPYRGGCINTAEFSSTGEYLLYGCVNGAVTVSKCSGLARRMREGWQDSSAHPPPLPVRQIHTRKGVEILHWTPENRNEIGLASKGSGDVVLFDLKTCGALSSQNHQAACVLTHRQGQGVGGILEFVHVAPKVVVAGTQSGTVVIWDRRDGKKPKGCLKQAFGSICFLQVIFLLCFKKL